MCSLNGILFNRSVQNMTSDVMEVKWTKHCLHSTDESFNMQTYYRASICSSCSVQTEDNTNAQRLAFLNVIFKYLLKFAKLCNYVVMNSTEIEREPVHFTD